MPSLVDTIKGGDTSAALAMVRAGLVDVNERGTEGPMPQDGGATCLLMAIRSFAPGDAELVSALLDGGADPNLADTLEGDTPLMSAARYHAYETSMIDALLAKGADMEKVNKNGDTALHVAASAGAAITAAYLIKRGANFKAKDRKGRTPMDIAPDAATKSSMQEAVESL